MTDVEVNADAIPDEVKERNQWLLWDASNETPRRPHWDGDFHVSWSDPDAWHSFEEALAAAESEDSWGVGYVTALDNDDHADGEYGVIDIDGGVETTYIGEETIECECGGNAIEWTRNEFADEVDEEGEMAHYACPGCGSQAARQWDSDGELLGVRWEDGTVETARGDLEESDSVQIETSTKDWVPGLDRFEDAMTYIERSPSGTGLHIPFTGEPPEWWTDGQIGDHEGVDVLTNKFCTFTGDTVEASGSGVADIDVTPWLLEAYHAVHGEYPRTETDDSDDGDRSWSEGDEWLTTEDVEDALSELDPDMAYSEWRDVAYAVHDFDDGPTGQSLFESWSESGTKYDDDAEEYIERFWSDTDQGSGITVATLVHKAKNAGWSPSSSRRAERAQERYNQAKNSEGGDEDLKPIEWDLVRDLFADPDVPAKRARRVAASALQMRFEYLYIDTEERLLKYHEPDGVFERGGERHVKQVLVRELGQYFSTHDRNEVLAMIQDEAAIDVDELNAADDDRRLLCLSNGVLNLDTLLDQSGDADLENVELLDHSPEFKFTRSVPVEFNPDASAENAEEFLREIVETDGQKQTLEEMMGAALYPGYLKSKFLFLFGEGSNGKGIYFELLSELLGNENVEGRGLHELANERFAKADLHGKLANIGGDIDDRKLKNVGELKRLTSGTDVVTAERKYGQPFKFTNRATLFFAANEPPAIEDQKRSMARRLVPIRMPFQFVEDPDEEDPYQKEARDEDELLDEMTTDEELAGLLNLALAGMKRLHDNSDVSLERGPMERLEHYQRFSDPIYRFATECMVKTAGETVQKEDVYEIYKQFSDIEGHGIRHNSVFWREFKRVFHVEETRPRDENGNKGPRQLIGTGFSEIALERYAPDKLAAKYESADASDDDDGDGGPSASTRFDPVPLADAAEDATGFPTVECEVVKVNQPDKGPAMKATVKDSSSAMKVVHWDNPDALQDGEKVVIENAGTSEFDGSTELVIEPHVTEIHPQPEAGQSQLEQDRAEADGGGDERSAEAWEPPEDAEGSGPNAKRVVAALLADEEDALEVDNLKLAVFGRYPALKGKIDKVDAAIEKARDKGWIMEDNDGRLRRT